MISATNIGVEAEITASVKKAVETNVRHASHVGVDGSTATRVHTSRSIAKEHVEGTPATAISIDRPLQGNAPHPELGMHLREHFIDAIDVTRAVR